MNGREACGHSNRVLARVSEGWMLEQVSTLVQNPALLNDAFEAARRQCQINLEPQQNKMELTNQSLRENQTQIDKIVEAITSDGLNPDLLLILNKKASQLRIERQQLLQEKKRLSESLMPLDEYFNALPLRARLQDFDRLVQNAEPQELQRLIRLLMKRVE